MFSFKSALAATLVASCSSSSSSQFALAFVSPQSPRPLVEARTHHRHIVANPANPTRRKDLTSRNLFGFGNAVEEDQKGLREGELARFQHLVPANDKADVKFDSLSTMIRQWSELFEDGRGMGLTTDVEVSQLSSPEVDGSASSSAGVKLVFKKRKAAYSDVDAARDGDGSDEGSKKDKTIREGGVQVVVALLEGDELQVTASRCDIDEGTIVKEMSEETIIDSLRKAVAAWKKEQL